MVYCGTLCFVRNTLSRFGVEFTCVDGSDPTKYEEALKPNTKVCFQEEDAVGILENTKETHFKTHFCQLAPSLPLLLVLSSYHLPLHNFN